MYFLVMIWEDAELLQLRQFHSFMESAPQLLLGLYIAIKEESLLEYSSIFKIVTCQNRVKIGSLSWALLSYDNKICLMNGKRDDAGQPSRSNVIRIDLTNESEKNDVINCIKNINCKESALSFFAHFSWIVARLIVLSLFASFRGWVIWMACLAHIFLIVIWHRGENYYFMDSLRLSFLHVFAYLYPIEKESDQKKHPRFSPLMYLTACICENLFLMLQWSQSFNEDKGINLKISSIQFYPWKDWKFFLPWIGHILMFILSFISFRLLNKHRKPFSPITPVSSVTI
ncbi:XK-related protein 6-like [Daphnia pulicaria]|uniref:XK-related protein 6-like n=1 Tax=Daphnia pulicaria TaxID=35523 RepID=UPI001EEA8DF0|nr:XK-related protein 6-like [Daphnia pulicaria]